jgi:hypothetical protein
VTLTQWARRGEQLAVLLIILGIIMMIQPITVVLLAYGFVVVLAGMVLFMITSHM